MLHTLMTVPLSEAVASRVPVELMERNEMGDLWAWITLATVSERVEKRMTSPACEEEAEEGGLSREAGDGTGDG